MTRPSPNGDAPAGHSCIETALDEQVRTAPQLLRSDIQELERQADPASNLRELVCGREERQMLGLAILELEQAIRKHRETQGRDRCGTSDLELYDAVDLSGGDFVPRGRRPRARHISWAPCAPQRSLVMDRVDTRC